MPYQNTMAAAAPSDQETRSTTTARPVNRPRPVLYLPTWSQLRIATKQRTQLGGDFFEVFQHGDGAVSTVMADVAGNGPSAATPVSDVRWVMRQHLARGESPGRVLAAVNEWLLNQKVHDRLVTAQCVRVDGAGFRATVASAGHLGPWVKRSSGGRAEGLALAPALALGILPGEIYEEVSVDLFSDDAMVLVTDGITDRLATRGDPLGEKGLLRRLTAAPQSAARICDTLLGSDAPSQLDATVVVLQVPPQHERARPTSSRSRA